MHNHTVFIGIRLATLGADERFEIIMGVLMAFQVIAALKTLATYGALEVPLALVPLEVVCKPCLRRKAPFTDGTHQGSHSPRRRHQRVPRPRRATSRRGQQRHLQNYSGPIDDHIYGLPQDCGNSSALALELPQTCAMPSICYDSACTTKTLVSTVEQNWNMALLHRTNICSEICNRLSHLIISTACWTHNISVCP